MIFTKGTKGNLGMENKQNYILTKLARAMNISSYPLLPYIDVISVFIPPLAYIHMPIHVHTHALRMHTSVHI